MTYLFSPANRRRLETFARSKVLLGFDYDGTLAPLVSTPSRAAMRVSTRRLLARVSELYPCVAISGRSRADARRRLRGVALGRVLGNHGAEPSAHQDKLRRRVRRWLPVVKRTLSGLQGVLIEDKGFSVAIHYRQARDRRAARRAILAAARSVDDVRIIGGKLAVNLLLPDAPHKGTALERERRRSGCDAVVYVGDDDTDEDVFRLNRPDRLLTIRVGRTQASAAACYIRDQAEIDRLLRMLVTLREEVYRDTKETA